MTDPRLALAARMGIDLSPLIGALDGGVLVVTGEQVTVGFTLFAAAWLGLTAWTAWRHERARRQALAIREAAETEWSI